mmetsp:Transcript_20748/g.33433  ORF Transcript_20748/g.33433 Transcript_20748/m.33433 type:complete len:207 (-) Transcript_20748:335-955(-)
MQTPGNETGQDSNKKGGISRRSFQIRDIVGIVPDITTAQLNGLNEISQGIINKGNGNEEFKDLRGKGRDFPYQTDESNQGTENMQHAGPKANPEKEGKVVCIKLSCQSVAGSQKERDGSGNTHNDKRLSRKDGVNDSNNGRTHESFRRCQIAFGLPFHEFGKNQGRDQLNDKGKDGRIKDGKDGLRFAPIAGVMRCTGLQIVLHAR